MRSFYVAFFCGFLVANSCMAQTKECNELRFTGQTAILAGETSADVYSYDVRHIQTLTVTITVTHSPLTDLAIYLESPVGHRTLLAHPTSGSAYTSVRFSDAATTSIADAPSPSGGTYRPLDPLTALVGEAVAGFWKIVVVNAGVAGGQLGAWKLDPCVDRDEIVGKRLCQTLVDAELPQDLKDTGTTTFKVYNNTPGFVVDASVNLTTEHPNDGTNLDLVLWSPSDFVLLVSDYYGPLGSTFTGTTFSDSAAQGIWQAPAPYTGTFRPINTFEFLHRTPARGVWTLEVTDHTPGGVGRVVSFSVDLCIDTGPAAPGDGEGEGEGERAEDCIVAVSQDVPATIPDAADQAGSASSSLYVLANGITSDLSVTLSIQHPYMPDLWLWLEPPGGGLISLANNVGLPGTDFTEVTFNRSSTRSLEGATPPYTGGYAFPYPKDLEKVFGRRPSGQWKLAASDRYGNDVGAITAWSLRLCVEDGFPEGENTAIHSVDRDQNGQVSLSELLRMVQLFNSGVFHCDGSTEDGYAPGPGDTSCAAYDADYDPADWSLSFSELLRVVQFFNSGGYHKCSASEDGFCPGL